MNGNFPNQTEKWRLHTLSHADMFMEKVHIFNINGTHSLTCALCGMTIENVEYSFEWNFQIDLTHTGFKHILPIYL